MTLDEMNEPKYQIGDCLSYKNRNIGLTVRGVMLTTSGYRYFIQIDESDNSLTLNDEDIDEMIEKCLIDKTID